MNQSIWFITILLLTVPVMAANPPEPTVTPPPSPATITSKDTSGTTIVGEHDAVMGLNLTPWKEELAIGMDQPPSLFRAPMTPADSTNLSRQTEYRAIVSSYRRTHSQSNP